MADTLLANYVGGIAGIPAEAWSIQCSQGMEQDVIKIMYNRKDDRTNTAIVCTSASFMLPVPMRRAFDLLKNNILRPKVRYSLGKWSLLFHNNAPRLGIFMSEQPSAIVSGMTRRRFALPMALEVTIPSPFCMSRYNNITNHAKMNAVLISLLETRSWSPWYFSAICQVDRVGNKGTKMILQNSSYDMSGSFLVYSSLGKELTEEMIMNLGSGNQEMGDTSLFPTGFFLVPVVDAEKPSSNIGEAGGTVMTAGHQTVTKLAHGTGLCPQAVSSLIKFLSEHVANVKDTLMNSHPIFYKGTPSTI
jgi:hypothetical protein